MKDHHKTFNVTKLYKILWSYILSDSSDNDTMLLIIDSTSRDQECTVPHIEMGICVTKEQTAYERYTILGHDREREAVCWCPTNMHCTSSHAVHVCMNA